MKFAYVILAAIAVAAAPAIAADPETPAATASTPPVAKSAKDPDRVICKTDDEIGSRIAKKKSCATAAQWRERAFRDGQKMDQVTSMRSGSGSGQ